MGITPVAKGYCIEQALIDKVVGQRKAGSTLSSRLQIAIASRQKVTICVFLRNCSTSCKKGFFLETRWTVPI